MEENNQDFVKCQKCRLAVAIVDGRCANCGELICYVCGCTASVSCIGGCAWARENVCTNCAEPVDDGYKNLDWDAAYEHFTAVRKQYQELAGLPGVNTCFALQMVFRPIAERYERGERTLHLYRYMTEIE